MRRRSRSTSARATTRRASPPDDQSRKPEDGIHDTLLDNAITIDRRFKVPHVENALALNNIKTEVELGSI